LSSPGDHRVGDQLGHADLHEGADVIGRGPRGRVRRAGFDPHQARRRAMPQHRHHQVSGEGVKDDDDEDDDDRGGGDL
jgi:hypothetical protein